MKILLLGPNGQVGWELQRALAPLGVVIALPRQLGDYCGDLAQPQALLRSLRQIAPDVIINAAAHTAVDKAESEPELAAQLNAEGPAALARHAAESNATLVHYSTDYVFDGSGQHARDEDAPTGPLSVYGRTKLAGEQAIRASGCRHLILRTSWVYAARGGNFAKTMLRLAAERDSLKVIADQVGAPTGAELIADVSAHALRRLDREPALAGTYHLAAGGQTSWHGYACHVIERARQGGATIKVAPQDIQAIPSSAYPTAAQRPLNSRLDTRRLHASFGVVMPDWRLGVNRMLDEIQG